MSGLIRMGRRCTDLVIRATLTEEELAQKRADEAAADARVANQERLSYVILNLETALRYGERADAARAAVYYVERIRKARDDRFDNKSALDAEVAP